MNPVATGTVDARCGALTMQVGLWQSVATPTVGASVRSSTQGWKFRNGVLVNGPYRSDLTTE